MAGLIHLRTNDPREPSDGIRFRRVRAPAELPRYFEFFRELTPELDPDTYDARMRAALAQGYRLVCCRWHDEPVCIAGYRILETLSWGRILFIDDLVTAPDRRSRGFGTLMVQRLIALAWRCGCRQVQLESAPARERAHRFYAARGFRTGCLRFVRPIIPPSTLAR